MQGSIVVVDGQTRQGANGVRSAITPNHRYYVTQGPLVGVSAIPQGNVGMAGVMHPQELHV